MLNVKHMTTQEAADMLEAAVEPRRMRLAGMLVTMAKVGEASAGAPASFRQVVVVQSGGDFLLIEDAIQMPAHIREVGFTV